MSEACLVQSHHPGGSESFYSEKEMGQLGPEEEPLYLKSSSAVQMLSTPSSRRVQTGRT